MGNMLKILIQIGCFVWALNFWACRQSNEQLIEEDLLAGKAFFTGSTPVNKHHGIQIIAYLKSDTLLTPGDTTSTDSTGYYSFGKPSIDGVYMVMAYYLFYYRDTVEVKFQGGRREGEIRDLHIRQKVRVRFTSDKNVYHLADLFTWTVEVMNISKDTLSLPNMSWFDYPQWHVLFFISSKNDSLIFGDVLGGAGHGPISEPYEPGKVMLLTRSTYINFFEDKNGNGIYPGRYFFYAMARSCLPLEWNNRIMPIFEPVEVEIVP